MYLAAESVRLSGVIAVVAAGMYIGRNIQTIVSPASRTQTGSMWTVTTYVLESLVFILIGVELPYVVRDLEPATLPSLVREAAVVFASVVVVRLAWLFPSAYAGAQIGRWIRHSTTRCRRGANSSLWDGPACAAPTRWSSRSRFPL